MINFIINTVLLSKIDYTKYQAEGSFSGIYEAHKDEQTKAVCVFTGIGCIGAAVSCLSLMITLLVIRFS